jgi:CheY-like chemotaxis protein
MAASYPRILIIDGYDDDRQYWVHQLKVSSHEYAILEAKNGAEGLALCKSKQVDCVILEMNLLEMSGFKVLVDLMALQEKIAVIILTRLDLPLMAHRAKSSGAQAYLIKARTSKDELDSAVRKALVTVGFIRKEL